MRNSQNYKQEDTFKKKVQELVPPARFSDEDKYAIKMSMMDGVTTGLDMELGALNIKAWYDREQGKWPINYGQCVSHELVRIVVHDGLKLTDPVDAVDFFKLRAEAVKDDKIAGWSVTRSNLDQMNKIDPGFVASVTALLTDTTVLDTDGSQAGDIMRRVFGIPAKPEDEEE